MRTYRCLKSCPILKEGSYSASSIQPEYIESVRVWRNQQMDVLRQTKPISPDEQKHYYQAQIWPSMDTEQPSQILLALLYNEVLIGYGGLVHISWENLRAEVSFLLDPSRVEDSKLYQQDFIAFLRLAKKIAFSILNFNRIFTETFSNRALHISTLEKTGFVLEGTLKEHVRINNNFFNSLIHGYLKSYGY